VPIATGTRVGGYEIVAPIGAGGMGEVYRARDLKLDRLVALKILPASFTTDAERVRRFAAEARIASSLNHPHLVAIYDVGEFVDDSGERKQFIAMELVDGITLRDQIDRERLPLKKTVLLLAQAADALAAAHHAGIAHRDIKPENILISRDGYVKVVDFGLAKLREPQQVTGSVATVVRGTEPGIMLGTVGYMSPEQAEGKPADHRSDVFSLGCVIYEAVSGKRAFTGSSRVDTLHKIISVNPEPISAVAPVAPQQLQWILRKCLAKDPDARYQSMKDLAIDLRELASDLDSGIGVSVAAPAQRRSSIAWIALAIIVVVAGVVTVLWRQTRRVASHPIEIHRLTDLGNVIEAAISPDGKYLSYVTSSSQGKQALWLKQIGSSQVVPIRPVEAVAYWGHAFSPDGTSVYYAIKSPEYTGGALFRVATLGGTPTLLLRQIDSPVSFSPDGAKITFIRGNFPTPEESALLVANSDGTAERVVAKRHEPDFLSGIFFAGPSWSPDGRSIAFTALQNKGSALEAQIRVVPSEGGEEKDVSNARWERVGQVAWLPDGKHLLAVAQAAGALNSQLWKIPVPSGTPERITQDLLDYRIVSLTRDGRSIVTIPTDVQSSIWSAPLDGGEAVRLTSGKGDLLSGFATLPDGRLIFASTEEGASDLWIAAADGSERHPIFASRAMRRDPAVSSDGSMLAFVTTPQLALRPDSAFNSLQRARIDGTDLRSLGHAELSAPAFTRDGKWLLFAKRIAGETRLARIPVDGGATSMVTSYVADVPAVSPDGGLIACVCREKPADRVTMCILPIAGGAPVRKFPVTVRYDFAAVVQWTVDGKALLFNAGPGDRANIYRQPLDGGPATKVTHFNESIVLHLAPSMDGKAVLMARVNLLRDAILISGFD
jgi:eukaryotic-like serine/threonine-protein kinase